MSIVILLPLVASMYRLLLGSESRSCWLALVALDNCHSYVNPPFSVAGPVTLRVPTPLLPGFRVPPESVSPPPPSEPEPPIAPPELTVTAAFPMEPLTLNSPAFTVVAPP